MSEPTAARRVAFEVLRRVFEHDAWTDRALRAAARRHRLAGRERALAQRIAYGSVQRRGTSDHLIGMLADRPAERLDPPLLAALRLGLFELLFGDGAAHAAVDQAVALAKGRGGGRRGSGLVNAVLRRAAREREPLLASLDDRTPDGAAVAHSHPRWLVELWWEELGPDATRALLAAANEPPERTFRATARGGGPAELLRMLAAAGAEVEPAASVLSRGADEPTGQDTARAGGGPRASIPLIRVRGGGWEAVEVAIADGHLVPQSRGSAAVVELLAPRPGERVLDLCAGPGIKATAIAELVGPAGELVAVERDRGRAAEIGELAARLGLGNVEVRHADATEAELGSDGGYDRVLVDPPCSGLGTLASRPDARWRRSPEEIERTAPLQRRILERAAAAVRSGGRIVYATCTISRRENEQVVERVLAARSDLRPEPLGEIAPPLAAGDRRFLQTRPDRDRTDGFFIAALERA